LIEAISSDITHRFSDTKMLCIPVLPALDFASKLLLFTVLLQPLYCLFPLNMYKK
jgi:hypothetical protein